MLKHDRMNTLEVYSQADRRNAPNSDPTRVSIRQDDQPPRITATLDPQPNEKGWNNGSVSVRFACTDAHGIARCPDPITVATAGEDQTIRAAAIDSAGNSETIKVRVNIDSTQPTAKITLSPAPNANGWYRSSVSVKFTCSDERNGSGIAQCPRPIDVKNAGRDVPVSGTVVDNAGNRTVVSATVNLDRTDPTITMDESHEVTLIYSSPIHLSGHISDDLSGVAAVSCGSSPASVTNMAFGCDVAVKAGKHRIKVWATDNAGNVATVHARVVLASPLPGGDAHKVMVSADVNGDGRIDVVHTNFSVREVSILLGNGDGTFQAERRVPVGEYASSVALADVNHDGVLDLVTTHYATAEVAVQYGQADGTYVAGPHIAVDDFPTAAVIADVNGDGLPDIVTAHMHNAKVQVHLAQIDGSFVSQPASTVGNGPVALAIGDVNGDGRLDIVSANFLSSDVSILPGLGVGKFGPEQRVVLSTGSGPTAILIADLNADGIADLATADFNANTVSIALRKSDGSYEGVQSMAVGQHPIALAAFDVTRDGLLDLITANLGSGDLSVLPGGAAGVFSTAQRWANAVVPAPLFVPRPILFRELVQLPASTATSDLNMPDPLAAAARPPAAGLPAPEDRVGLTFGLDTANYSDLFGPNGAQSLPLTISKRAGMNWIRLDGNRSNFIGPDAFLTYTGYSETVDRMLAAGFNVHVVVTDFRWWPPIGIQYPADFPSATYLNEYAQFAADLARAAHRPGGRVIFEVWNEPDAFSLFWSPERTGVDEAALFARMLTQVTEAIHTAAPGSTVVSGGLTNESGPYTAKFLPAYNEARKNRPLASVDRFGLHPYPGTVDNLARFRTQLNAAGLAAFPIDITEVGGWWASREWVAQLNATILLRSIEADLPHINFWAARSPVGEMAMAGFIDAAPQQTIGCRSSVYGEIRGVTGYDCHPSLFVARIFDRMARGRTYSGTVFDARVGALPGSTPTDSLSGLHALKFETDEDVVIAAFTQDRPRRDVAGSGKSYSIAFPREPAFVVNSTGHDFAKPDANGRYQVTHDAGPLYFVFTKNGQPPAYTVNARTICQDGSAPIRGQLKIWHTVWPTPVSTGALDWQSVDATTPGALTGVSRQMPSFIANMYVAAEALDVGGFLPVQSSVKTAGGPGAPNVTGNTFFNPPTQMARLDAPGTSSSTFTIEYLAPAQWCTP